MVSDPHLMSDSCVAQRSWISIRIYYTRVQPRPLQNAHILPRMLRTTTYSSACALLSNMIGGFETISNNNFLALMS